MQILSESEFRKQIKSNTNGAFLFYGDEDYLKAHAVNMLKKEIGIEEALELFNFVSLDVLDYTPDKLIDALSLPPMMAEKKLVVLTGMNIIKLRPEELTALINAIKHIEEFDYNTFVLSVPADCFDEGYLPKKPSSTLKTFAELMTVVKFERSTPAQLASWAQRHFVHEGIKASGDDCACLVDYCGKNMLTLSHEIEKLAFYVRSQNRDTLKREDIFEICCAELEYDSFEFANAILANRPSDALKTLSAMKFKQVEPLVILGELSAIAYNLLNTKLMLLAGKGVSDISPIFNRSEYKTKLYIKAANARELDSLKRMVALCRKTDTDMKSSFDSRSYLPLEKLICEI